MARAITAGELVKLRGDGQYSRLYLAIPLASTVLKASVTAAPAPTLGSIHEVAISIISGSAASALADMTVMVTDSTEATIKGYCRVCKTPTTSLLYIGEISDGEIDWAVNDRVHVLNEFCTWPRHIRIVGETTYYMDWDVAYSDQHSAPAPLVNMGPDAVLWLTGANVQLAWDASGSTVIIGSISSYSWAASGPTGVTISNGSTATPTMTFTAAGDYRIACTVTTAAGTAWTGYRWVHIYSAASMPVTQFVLNSPPSGNIDSGGWGFSVTLLAEADIATVRDRAKVILFARDWYQGVEGSLGPVAGRENILCTGWIAGETIQVDPDTGNVTFDVKGPAHWLNISDAFPTGLEDTDFANNGGGAASSWTEMENLDTDRAIWHFLHWRTTITRFMDVTLTGDTKQAATIKAPNNKLWAQLVTLANATILARPCCDRFGRLFVQVDQAYLPLDERDALPVVMDLTGTDRETFTITRRAIPRYGQVEISGVYYAGGNAAPMGARSPGDVPMRVGQEVLQLTELIMGNQAGALEQAGLIAGSGAGPIESAAVAFAENNRFVDVVPYQWLRVTLAAGDTVRGVALTNARLIPRTVNFAYNSDTGVLSDAVECEGEGTQLGSKEMEFPGEGGEEPEPGEPEEPPTPPGEPEEPPVVGDGDAVVVTSADVRSTADLDQASPTWTTEL